MSLPQLIDGHAHLDGIPSLDPILAEARVAGVGAVIAVGMNRESNKKTLAIAERYRGFVFPALGYHPWEIREPEIAGNLEFLASHIDRAVAIGEVGIDYKVRVKKALQREVFGEIIRLAVMHDKPLILHCRFSHERVFDMVGEGGVEKAVFHWYSGSLDLLRRIVAAGYHISATPALRYSEAHRRAIEAAPLERILLETDCPVVYGERESRPRDVLTTAREVAGIKGLRIEEVAAVTSRTTRQFYGGLMPEV